jgi:rod shape-determining protein MreC
MLQFWKKRVSIKKTNINIIVFVLLFSLSFFLLVFSTRPFLTDFKEFGFAVLSSSQSLISGVEYYFNNTVNSIKELKNLKTEYEELSEQLKKYTHLERDFANIKRENLYLKEIFGLSQDIDLNHYPAKIIGKNPDNYFSAFIINRGSVHGLKKNMPVIAYQDGMRGLVGKVVLVGRYNSLIMPIFDYNAHVAARLSLSRYEGMVSGLGSQDLPLQMKYIKKRAKDDISRGDVVVTSGLGGIYPPEIPIGRIKNINLHEFESSLILELESIIDYSKLEYLFVVDYTNPLEEEGEDD